MYMRLAQGNLDASRIDDYLAVLRSVLPNLRTPPGFKNAYVGVNRETARGVVVTTYDTEEPPTTDPPAEVIARLQAAGLQPEPILVFEVTDEI
jgi:hypothetical protein